MLFSSCEAFEFDNKPGSSIKVKTIKGEVVCHETNIDWEDCTHARPVSRALVNESILLASALQVSIESFFPPRNT